MQIQKQRLDYLDELLLACGWSRSENGWLAPEKMRDLLVEEVGTGHVKRWVALAAQVQFDEACVRAACAQASGDIPCPECNAVAYAEYKAEVETA